MCSHDVCDFSFIYTLGTSRDNVLSNRTLYNKVVGASNIRLKGCMSTPNHEKDILLGQSVPIEKPPEIFIYKSSFSNGCMEEQQQRREKDHCYSRNVRLLDPIQSKNKIKIKSKSK